MTFARPHDLELQASQLRTTEFPGFLKVLALVSVGLFVLWPKFVTLPGVGANIYIVIQVFLTLLFAPCLILWGSGRGARRLSVNQRLICISFGVIVLLELISFIFGGPDAQIDGYIRQLIGVKLMFLVGFIISDDEKAIRNLFKVLFYTLLISFLVAVWEQSARKSILAVVSQTLHITTNDVITAMTSDKLRGGSFRSGAFFDHPIILSIAASIAVPLGLMMASQSRGWGKLFVVGFVGLAIVAGYSTFSRTFIVGLVAGFGSYFVFRQMAGFTIGRWRTVMFSMLGLMLFLAVILPVVIDTVAGRTGLEQYSSTLRNVMWERAAPYIGERPLLGWGWGSDVFYAGIKRSVMTVDDSYLTLLVNNGVVGLIALGVFVAACLLRGLALIVGRRDWPGQVGSVACAAILLVLVCQKSNSIPAAFAFVYLFGGLLAGMKVRSGSLPVALPPLAAVPVHPRSAPQGLA